MSQPRLKLLLAYGAGDAGFNCFWVLVESFLLYFLADSAHLSVWAITPALLCGRGADLVGGWLFGAWADRVRTRIGSYRPFLLACAVPLWASLVLLFSFRPGRSGWALAAVYTLFAVLYSAANVAYTALLSVVSRSEAERARLSSARFVAAAAAVLAVQYGTLPLVTRLGAGNAERGWQRAAVLCGASGALLILACFAGTRETYSVARHGGPGVGRSLRVVLTAHGFARLLLAMTASLAALTCRSAMTPFYVRYVELHPEWISGALVANSLAALVACGLIPWVRRGVFDARRAARWSAWGGSLFCMTALLCPRGNEAALIAEQVVFGGATGILLPAVFTLFSRFPDRLEKETEGNTAGMVASASTTALKLGATVGSAMAAAALGWMHFVPNSVQAAGAITGITAWFSVLPAAMFGVAGWALLSSDTDAGILLPTPEPTGDSGIIAAQ